MSGILRIAIVDHSSNVRQKLIGRLRLQQNLCITGIGANEREAIKLAVKQAPDVMVFGVIEPNSDADTIRQVLAASPQTKCVVWAPICAANPAAELKKAGASDFVERSVAFEPLLQSIGYHCSRIDH